MSNEERRTRKMKKRLRYALFPWVRGLTNDQQGEDARMSKKILDLARDQQEEIARELGEDEWEDEDEEEQRGGP